MARSVPLPQVKNMNRRQFILSSAAVALAAAGYAPRDKASDFSSPREPIAQDEDRLPALLAVWRAMLIEFPNQVTFGGYKDGGWKDGGLEYLPYREFDIAVPELRIAVYVNHTPLYPHPSVETAAETAAADFHGYAPIARSNYYPWDTVSGNYWCRDIIRFGPDAHERPQEDLIRVLQAVRFTADARIRWPNLADARNPMTYF